MRPLRVEWLGRAAYRPVWARMEELRGRILAGDDDAERLLFVEHEPVVTLGRATRPGHVTRPVEELEAAGVEVVPTSRGGDVTYHGPGQLVIYPVVRLPAGVVAFVESLGAALAEELRAEGIAAEWRRRPAGVWIEGTERKIAACGIHVSRRVTIHGFALNVGVDSLGGFGWIVPCGLAGIQVTCMARESRREPPALDVLAARLGARIARAWDRAPRADSPL